MQQAERVLREGLALENMPVTDHGNLAYMLALLLVEQGKAEQALEWMQTAAQAMPEHARIRYNQGLLLARLNRGDDAILAATVTGAVGGLLV